MLHLIADRLDLAIDLLTLGQYGLEPAPTRDPHCTTGSDCCQHEQHPHRRRRGAHVALDLSEPRRRAARSRP